MKKYDIREIMGEYGTDNLRVFHQTFAGPRNEYRLGTIGKRISLTAVKPNGQMLYDRFNSTTINEMLSNEELFIYVLVDEDNKYERIR